MWIVRAYRQLVGGETYLLTTPIAGVQVKTLAEAKAQATRFFALPGRHSNKRRPVHSVRITEVLPGGLEQQVWARIRNGTRHRLPCHPPRGYITTELAAKRLGISRHTLYSMLSDSHVAMVAGALQCGMYTYVKPTRILQAKAAWNARRAVARASKRIAKQT